MELRNVSHSAGVIEVPLTTDLIAFEMKDEAGRAVEEYNYGSYDGFSFDLGMLRLPHDSQLRFNIASQGVSVPKDQGGLLDIGGNVWVFPRGEKHSYFLTAKFTIKETKEPVWKLWAGTIEIPLTKLPVIQ